MKEVYRRERDQTVSLVIDCAQKSLATIQLKHSGLVLFNIDVEGEDSSTFNQEVGQLLHYDP